MLSESQIAELESKYGEVAVLRGPAQEFEVVFRKPTRIEHKMFRANLHNPAKVSEAQELLSLAVVVHPGRDEYQKLLDSYPGIPDSPAFSNAMQRLLRLGAEEAGK